MLIGQLVVRQIATGQDAILLGSRSEPQKGQGLLSRLGAQLARPFVALKEWIGNLLGTDKRAAAPKAQTAVSPEDLQRLMKQAAFGSSLGGFAKADVLNNIAAEQLGKEHANLATGNGPLRSLCTALQAVVGHGQTLFGAIVTFQHHFGIVALAHQLKDKAEAAYQRGSLLERRRVLMADWANYCAKPAATGVVVPLQSAKSA